MEDDGSPAGAPEEELAGERVAPVGDQRPTRPTTRRALPNERFLQQALGTQGDVRLPAMLLALASLLAVGAVAWRRLRGRSAAADDEDEEDDDAEEREDPGGTPSGAP